MVGSEGREVFASWLLLSRCARGWVESKGMGTSVYQESSMGGREEEGGSADLDADVAALGACSVRLDGAIMSLGSDEVD